MPLDAKAAIHRWFEEVWNRGREETIDELMSPEGVRHGLGAAESDIRGPAGFKVFWRNMRSALPDIHMTLENTVTEDDRAVALVTLEGTHTGDGLGVPPTGRRVHVRGIAMIRVAGDHMVEGWNSWDQLGLLQQIGAVPVHHSADRFLAART